MACASIRNWGPMSNYSALSKSAGNLLEATLVQPALSWHWSVAVMYANHSCKGSPKLKSAREGELDERAAGLRNKWHLLGRLPLPLLDKQTCLQTVRCLDD